MAALLHALSEEAPRAEPAPAKPLLPRRQRPSLTLTLAPPSPASASRPASVLGCLEARGYMLHHSVQGGSGGSLLRRLELAGESLLLKCGLHGEAATRLEAEYKILKSVDGHDNIVRAREWCQSSRDSGFVMTFHDGVVLRLFIRSMPFDSSGSQARRISSQLLGAVEYLHSKQVAHRDLHSRNVIVEQTASGQEKAVLIDFGSASSTAALVPPVEQVTWRLSPSQTMTESDIIRRGSAQSLDGLESPRARSKSVSSSSRQPSKVTREPSKCSVFAGECTMPLIMPPDQAPHGPGSAAKRDTFALGLLVAGLVRRRNTETRDMFDETMSIRPQWHHPSPPLSLALASVVHGLVDIDPRVRLSAKEAGQRLPPAGCWFEAGAWSEPAECDRASSMQKSSKESVRDSARESLSSSGRLERGLADGYAEGGLAPGTPSVGNSQVATPRAGIAELDDMIADMRRSEADGEPVEEDGAWSDPAPGEDPYVIKVRERMRNSGRQPMISTESRQACSSASPPRRASRAWPGCIDEGTREDSEEERYSLARSSPLTSVRGRVRASPSPPLERRHSCRDCRLNTLQSQGGEVPDVQKRDDEVHPDDEIHPDEAEADDTSVAAASTALWGSNEVQLAVGSGESAGSAASTASNTPCGRSAIGLASYIARRLPGTPCQRRSWRQG